MIGSLWYALFSLSFFFLFLFSFFFVVVVVVEVATFDAACDCLCLLKFLVTVVCCRGEWLLLLSLLVLLSLLRVSSIRKMLDFSMVFSLSKKGE